VSSLGTSPVPVFTEIDHVAVAVHDLDAAAAWYRRSFGAEVVHRERVDHDRVEEALIRVADSYVQLLAPTAEDSPVARFLARRGEGLHHVAYRVDDVAAALAQAVAGGAEAIDTRPRPGGRGTTVAFLHPAGAFGTLIELVQEGAETRAKTRAKTRSETP
jgi:methylmalonyl-CoA epimerase